MPLLLLPVTLCSIAPVLFKVGTASSSAGATLSYSVKDRKWASDRTVAATIHGIPNMEVIVVTAGECVCVRESDCRRVCLCVCKREGKREREEYMYRERRKRNKMN